MKFQEILFSVSKNKYVRIAAGLLLFLVVSWFFLKPKPVVIETETVSKGIYEQIVEEEGNTRVKEKFTLFSPVNGVLQRVNKQVGEKVVKGETVALVHWDYDRKIQAPVTGTILSIQRESEGPIAMGAPILEIGNTNQLEIVCELLTQDSIHVHAEDPVQIAGWGGDPIPGKVRTIEPSAFTKISSLGVEEQRVRVIIDFNPPEQMGDAFQVIAKIISFRKENALILPTAALFREGQKWAVFQVIKGKAKKVFVKIEARSGKFSLLTDGLKEGDSVILFPNEDIKDGVRVK